MPKRSASRPTSTPPPAKPNMTMVKGRDALARLTPKSAWIVGSATMIDHMPTPPMVQSVIATSRRSHAAGESTPPEPSPVGTFMLGHPAFRFAGNIARRSIPDGRGPLCECRNDIAAEQPDRRRGLLQTHAHTQHLAE